MKKKLLLISSISVAVAFFSGCGNNNNGGTKATALNKGVFTDSPVKNLYYQTSSGVKGYTDQNGTFEYKNGDYVTFKIGNLTLGKAKAVSVVTPNSFLNINSSITIPLVLQNLDTDGNISNGIQLPNQKVLDQISFKDINLSNPTTTFTNLATIKTELKNKGKNYKFPNIDPESAIGNYQISSMLNYFIFMKDSETSFLVIPNQKIITLKNGQIYIDNKLSGDYKINQTLLSKAKNRPFYTSENPPSDTITIDNSSEPLANSFASILDLNISGHILRIMDVTPKGDIWSLNTSNGMLPIKQTNNFKNAILMQFASNQSFKTNINQEFYITKMTFDKKEQDGKIDFHNDGKVTITFGNKKINAFTSSDGNIYSNSDNFVILDASSLLFDSWHDVLISRNSSALYIIGSKKDDIDQIKPLMSNQNDFNTYLRLLNSNVYSNSSLQ